MAVVIYRIGGYRVYEFHREFYAFSLFGIQIAKFTDERIDTTIQIRMEIF